VRQHRKLCREAEVGERLGDVGLPGARADQAAAEAVRLAELEADVVHRRAQPRRGAFRAPQFLDPLVLVVKRGAVCGIGNAPQGCGNAGARLVHLALALGRGGTGRKMQRVVHHAQVVLVVQESGVGVDLRIHADPELHVALEGLRARHRIVRARRRARQERQGGE